MEKTARKPKKTYTGKTLPERFNALISYRQKRAHAEKYHRWQVPYYDLMVRLAKDCLRAGLTVYVTDTQNRLTSSPTLSYFHVTDGRKVIYVDWPDEFDTRLTLCEELVPSRKHGSAAWITDSRILGHDVTVEDILQALQRRPMYGPEYTFRDASHWESREYMLTQMLKFAPTKNAA